MEGRLEVVPAAHQRVEVPPGEPEPREQPNGRVRGEIARMLRRAERIHGREPDRTADRRERIAARSADLERDPAPVQARGSRVVEGFLWCIGGVERRLEIAGPRGVAVQREAERQRETRCYVDSLANTIQAVMRVAGVPREGEPRQRAPGTRALELPRPGVVLRAQDETQVRSRPVVLDLEDAL